MSRKFKWHMFFTSFLPLWFSIIIVELWNIGINDFIKLNFSDGKAVLRFLLNIKIEIIVIVILITLSIISVKYINKEIKKQEKSKNKEVGRILRTRRANKLSAEFLLAYILPMIAFDFNELDEVILFLIYFVVLSFLCIRNSNVYTNIFLEFKGYRMYECDIKCKVLNGEYVYTDCLVISKNDLTQPLPRVLEYFDFENYIYIDVGGTDE